MGESNSREGINLFAIRLEVWKIAESPPAVRLNAIEEPSEWKEKARRSAGELTKQKRLQEDFWSEFRDRIQEADTPLRARKPGPRHHYGNPIGKSGFHISFLVDSDSNRIDLHLIIEDDEDAFWTLKGDEGEITDELGTDVIWEEPWETHTGNMRSIIRVNREGDIEDRDQWEEYFDWMLDYGERFHEVFKPRLQNLD